MRQKPNQQKPTHSENLYTVVGVKKNEKAMVENQSTWVYISILDDSKVIL